MSIDATRWAWQQKVSPTQKLVLLSLADRANETHECYPSTTRLNIDTGLHRETIFDAIKALEELKLLKVHRTLGIGNRFALLGVPDRNGIVALSTASMNKPTGTDKPTGTENQTGTGMENPTTQSGKADTHQSGKADTESINESINNQSVKSTKKNKSSKHDLLEGITPQIANDYLAIRKEKKLPLTKTALDAIIAEAASLDMTLEQALTMCCENSWAGFKASWVLNLRAAGSKGTSDWRANDASVLAKAAELGVSTIGKMPRTLMADIEAAIEKRSRQPATA
jgi:DNA-binding transcriptional regulator YhcF (GntR family)